MRKTTLVLLITFFTISITNAQTIGKLWGMTEAGGDSGGGTVFNYDNLNYKDSIALSFSPVSAKAPYYTNLIQATDGNLYGMSELGGSNNYGTIFKCTHAGVVTTLYNFTGYSDGGNPYGSLMQASDGSFYGMTSEGGAYGAGSIFKFTTAGVLTTIYSFTGNNDGAGPDGSLIQATDGNLYGMTTNGGASGDGAIFKCTTSGTFTSLYNFTGIDSDGANPYGSFLQASDGNLYGMTLYGGYQNNGTIFKCTTSGIVTPLYSFTGIDSDGASPYGNLIQATDGNLYGMTFLGGTSGEGVIFKCTTSGTVTLLHSFNPGVDSDAAGPFGSLIQSVDGNLYGITTGGGAMGYGAIFKYTISGTIATIYSFDTTTANGALPFGSIMQASDGDLYGMTNQGGTSNNGVLFKCTVSGAETKLLDFGNNAIGSNPYSSLVQATDGNFYGMTENGGTQGYGTIFKYNTSGVDSILYNFNVYYPFAGINPPGSLIQGNDGNLYGIAWNSSSNGGTIFQCTTTGIVTILHNFSGPCFGKLLQASDGNLYGMTYQGGAGNGYIFKCTLSGTFTNLHNFANGASDGACPTGSLIQASDGNLYGMTGLGGASNSGIIFQCTTSGVVTLIYSFAGGSDGDNPTGDLIQATDGNLYGMTHIGGSSGKGVIFKCTTAGVETIIHNFNGASDGANANGSLIQASDGNLYGMTTQGGSLGLGTLFESSLTGAVTTLKNLTGKATGSYPKYGSLIEAMGVNVSYKGNCSIDTLTANPRGARSPYTYLWSTGATTSSIIVTSAGNYSVAITDARGITVNTTIGSENLLVNSGSGKTICNGSTVNLSAVNIGGTGTINYIWKPGSLSGSSPSVKPSSTTTYTVLATDANGCKDSATETIKVNSLPTITITGRDTILLGQIDSLTASGTSTSYVWTSGSTNDTAKVSPGGTTTYTVTGTDANGCTDTASFRVVVTLITGINNLTSSSNVTLYPNPATETAYLRFDMKGSANAIITLIDVSGNKVMATSSLISNGKLLPIDVSALAQGTYFIKVSTNSTSQVLRFIKE